MCTEFKGKTIFITGAAKGQGRATALAFARDGANIVAFDLGAPIPYPSYSRSSNEDLENLRVEIETAGGRAVICSGDVRRADEVKAAVERGLDTFGKIDVLFSNAGIAAYGFSQDLEEEEWDTMIDINLKGGWQVSRHIIPYMIRQKSGVIIYNSSVAGVHGMYRMSHYSASKHGLVGLARSQAIELAQYGIRVNTICPTGVNTPMNDGLAGLDGTTVEEWASRPTANLLPVPWIEPEDTANAVKFLASDKARYVTGIQFLLDAGCLTR